MNDDDFKLTVRNLADVAEIDRLRAQLAVATEALSILANEDNWSYNGNPFHAVDKDNVNSTWRWRSIVSKGCEPFAIARAALAAREAQSASSATKLPMGEKPRE